MMDTDTDLESLELGPMLRRLRGMRSLGDVHRLTGVTTSYLSQIERGLRHPGPSSSSASPPSTTLRSTTCSGGRGIWTKRV